MSKFEKTLLSISQDFDSFTNDRSEFLANCVKERLESNFKKYDDEFDCYINNLESYTKSSDFDKMSCFIKSFSDTISVIFNTLIKEINDQQKFINNVGK